MSGELFNLVHRQKQAEWSIAEGYETVTPIEFQCPFALSINDYCYRANFLGEFIAPPEGIHENTFPKPLTTIPLIYC